MIKVLAILLINWTCSSSYVISNKGDYVYELDIAKERFSLLITPTLTNCGFKKEDGICIGMLFYEWVSMSMSG
jgi:hypothetical protein